MQIRKVVLAQMMALGPRVNEQTIQSDQPGVRELRLGPWGVEVYLDVADDPLPRVVPFSMVAYFVPETGEPLEEPQELELAKKGKR